MAESQKLHPGIVRQCISCTSYFAMDPSDARDILRNLRAPIADVDALLALLGPPLNAFGLVPRGTRLPIHGASFDRTAIASIFPELQRAVLVDIAPVWQSALRGAGYDQLLDQFFCPVAVAARGHGECVAVLAYSTLLSNPLDTWGLAMLEQVCNAYSLSDLYWGVFSGPLWTTISQQTLTWEDLVRFIPTVPARVANALGGKNCPPALEYTPFNRRLCLEFHDLVDSRKQATGTSSSSTTTNSRFLTHCRRRYLRTVFNARQIDQYGSLSRHSFSASWTNLIL